MCFLNQSPKYYKYKNSLINIWLSISFCVPNFLNNQPEKLDLNPVPCQRKGFTQKIILANCFGDRNIRERRSERVQLEKEMERWKVGNEKSYGMRNDI